MTTKQTDHSEKELISMNDQLYGDFEIQELEERLETDPLMLGGLVDLFSEAKSTAGWCILDFQIDCVELHVCVPNV